MSSKSRVLLLTAACAAGVSSAGAPSARADAVNTTARYTNTAGATSAAPQRWNDGTNWSSNPNYPSGEGAGAIFTGPTAARFIVMGEAITVGSIAATNDTNFATTLAPGGGSLTLDAANDAAATITIDGSGTGNFNVSATMTLVSSVTAVVNQTTASSAAGALNITGAINGTGGFTKQGPGVLTFGTTAKNYTGPTLFDTNSGRTRISAAATPGDSSSVRVNAGAQLELITAGTYDLGAGILYLNGNGPVAPSPQAAFAGAIRPSTNREISIANDVVLESNTSINVARTSTSTSGGSLTFEGDISGPGRLIAAGAGAGNSGYVALNGANTFTGGALVTLGTLAAGSVRAADIPTVAGATFGAGDVSVEPEGGAPANLEIRAGALNAINDAATLSLAGGGAAGADTGYILLENDNEEVVGRLLLAGVEQEMGRSYGSAGSGADVVRDEFFAGPGVIRVVPEPGSLSLLALGLTALLRRRRREV